MMICSKLAEVIGMSCQSLSDDGNIAIIGTPFQFDDGGHIPVFVESDGRTLRFFDDGGVLLHLLGRGMQLDNHRKTRFLKGLTEPHGVLLNKLGELEIKVPEEQAAAAFASYISSMLAIVRWEREQEGVATDLSLLLDEVALCLRAWKQNARFEEQPTYTGISGHIYKLDFKLDDDAVLAIAPHPTTLNAAAKKLLDIRGSEENANLRIIVVIDDRRDGEAARREGRIFDALGNVLMMSRLEKNAGLAREGRQ